MSEWRRVPPAKPELPLDDKSVLVYFEGRIDIGSYEKGDWYIRRLGLATQPRHTVTWWRPLPEIPGGEE